MIKIMVAYEHPAFRTQLMQQLLHNNFEIALYTDNKATVIGLLKEYHKRRKELPTAIILSYRHTRWSESIETIAKLSNAFPGIKIIVLAQNAEDIPDHTLYCLNVWAAFGIDKIQNLKDTILHIYEVCKMDKRANKLITNYQYE
jgi:hypothetical protein